MRKAREYLFSEQRLVFQFRENIGGDADKFDKKNKEEIIKSTKEKREKDEQRKNRSDKLA